jgi:TRAP-type C4-dicarboxylate transport system permease small subunit
MSRRWRQAVDRGLEQLLAVLMAAMVLNVCWQVATRFLLRSPSSYTEELARFLLIWVGLLGASYAFGQRMHLAIDLLARARPRWQVGLRALATAATVLFALGALGGGGTRLVALTLDLGQTSAALGWNLGYVYLAVPLSGLLISYYAVDDWLRSRRED